MSSIEVKIIKNKYAFEDTFSWRRICLYTTIFINTERQGTGDTATSIVSRLVIVCQQQLEHLAESLANHLTTDKVIVKTI